VNFTNFCLKHLSELELLFWLNKIDEGLGKIFGSGIGLIIELDIANHKGEIFFKFGSFLNGSLKLGFLLARECINRKKFVVTFEGGIE
jgi:hypothetical protein